MEPGSTYIPGGFFAVANGWTKSPNGIKMPSDNQLSAFLAACGSRFARQTAKGKKFTEEGYVRNIMFNNLCSTSPYGLLRSICLPSMKGGYYIVHAVIEKGTGDILAGHCLCPAGLSGSCQHVVGLLLTACNLAPQGEDTTCTDVPCAWIVPPQAIQPLSLDDRAVILESTMGQAENKKWHQERIGRLTASVFKKLLRCRKPDGAVRDVMYPRQDTAFPRPTSTWQWVNAADVDYYVEPLRAMEPLSASFDYQPRPRSTGQYRRPSSHYRAETEVSHSPYFDMPVYFEELRVRRPPPSRACYSYVMHQATSHASADAVSHQGTSDQLCALAAVTCPQCPRPTHTTSGSSSWQPSFRNASPASDGSFALSASASVTPFPVTTAGRLGRHG
ncbi:hypothetical protein HPB49_014140 [Dermacentor silvarum]|uniref:Uncharacterized protein n=1 Tax=Dermacentor silvarum TaxID=543639 RepID=A0ACB8DDJ9_DERSI|nr:hypothetical protein HPB49_014140 [Dermacentor silvarum]